MNTLSAFTQVKLCRTASASYLVSTGAQYVQAPEALVRHLERHPERYPSGIMSETGADMQVPVAIYETAPLLSEQEMSFYKNEKEVGSDGKENLSVSSDTQTRPWSTGLFDCMPVCASSEPGWASTDWEICKFMGGSVYGCVGTRGGGIFDFLGQFVVA